MIGRGGGGSLHRRRLSVGSLNSDISELEEEEPSDDDRPGASRITKEFSLSDSDCPSDLLKGVELIREALALEEKDPDGAAAKFERGSIYMLQALALSSKEDKIMVRSMVDEYIAKKEVAEKRMRNRIIFEKTLGCDLERRAVSESPAMRTHKKKASRSHSLNPRTASALASDLIGVSPPNASAKANAIRRRESLHMHSLPLGTRTTDDAWHAHSSSNKARAGPSEGKAKKKNKKTRKKSSTGNPPAASHAKTRTPTKSPLDKKKTRKTKKSKKKETRSKRHPATISATTLHQLGDGDAELLDQLQREYPSLHISAIKQISRGMKSTDMPS